MREEIIKDIQTFSDALHLLDSVIDDIREDYFLFEFIIVTKSKKTLKLKPTAGDFENIFRKTIKEDVEETRKEAFRALTNALEKLKAEENQ